MEALPVELFLEGYSPAIRAQANRLRAIVMAAVPEATERVRLGWRLIGYDLPLRKGTRYFAWVALEPEHVHLGFQYGVWMQDPDHVLRGAHLRLRKVRYLTYQPGQPVARASARRFVQEAAAVARLSTAERTSRALDRGWSPDLGRASR